MLLHTNISLLFPAAVPFKSPATIYLNLAAVGLAVALATKHLQMGTQATLEGQIAQGSVCPTVFGTYL